MMVYAENAGNVFPIKSSICTHYWTWNRATRLQITMHSPPTDEWAICKLDWNVMIRCHRLATAECSRCSSSVIKNIYLSSFCTETGRRDCCNVMMNGENKNNFFVLSLLGYIRERLHNFIIDRLYRESHLYDVKNWTLIDGVVECWGVGNEGRETTNLLCNQLNELDD